MFYNQFNNSCNREEKDNCNKVKGVCTVKVIQECCYPSYIDLNTENNNKHDDECDCKKENDYNKECCCHEKEDKWEDKHTCNCNHKNDNNYSQKRSCGICSCFRRW